MVNTGRLLEELYFITLTVVDWVDIFSRPKYKHLLLDALAHCQQRKGLRIYAWVLMSNHLHAIVSAVEETKVSSIIRDLKKFTSKRILSELRQDLCESRREWMLERFRPATIKGFRVWQEGYHPELLYTYDFYRQKLDYIHDNPVRQEIVTHPEDYLYSSARDYAGDKGLLDITVVP